MSRKLNGIPNNLVDSFFSTLRYYSGGYMDDWVLNVMRKYDLREASLDVVKVTAEPIQLAINPILTHLESLQYIIKNELKINGFPSDYITKAVIKINYDPSLPERTFYPENWTPEKTFYAQAIVTDKEGKIYEMPKKAIHSFEDLDVS